MRLGRSGTLALTTAALFVFGAGMAAAHPPEHSEPVPVERLNLISSEEGGLALHENASQSVAGQAVYEFESEDGLPCCSWWYHYDEPVEEPLPFASEDFRLADEIGVIEAVLAVEWVVDDFEEPLNLWGEEWYLYVELVVDVACDTYRSGFEIVDREGQADVPLTLYGEHEHEDSSYPGHGNESEACVTPMEVWAHDATATLYIHPIYYDTPEDYVFDERIRISFDTAGASFVELPVFVPEPEPAVAEETVEPVAAAPAGNASADSSSGDDEVVMQVPTPGLLPVLLGALAAIGVVRRRHS